MGFAHRKDPSQRRVWSHPRRWRWMGRRLSGSRAGAGFSLTEMMVVFVMISILAGFAIPMVGRSIEQALVGTPVADPENPIEAVRVVRSFDPCLACAVH